MKWLVVLVLVLVMAMAAALAGCAAAPPVHRQEPAKPIPWRSIFTVQSDGAGKKISADFHIKEMA